MNFEVQASAGSATARTTNLGTAESPKTLLAGLTDSFYLPEVPDQPIPSARITLSAFDNSCPEDVEWSKSGPTWGHWLDGQQTGNTVVYYAHEQGSFTFTADCGCETKSIDVYVARTDITKGPEYIFANAEGRIPFEFELEGTGNKNFFIDSSSNFNTESWYLHEAVWGEGDPEVDTWEQLPYHLLGTFGPTWDSVTEENGQHNSYKVITDIVNPYYGTELEGPGKTENLYININCTAKIDLGDEETNFARIEGPYAMKTAPPSPLYKIDDWQVRFLDRKWPVINIGKPVTFPNAYACIKGTERFHHLKSYMLLGNEPCLGKDLYTDEEKNFYHNGDLYYYEESERHYHHSVPDMGGRGFDNVAVGMTAPLNSDGFTIEARLHDDPDPLLSDCPAYLARALDGGIATHVFVSYSLRETDRFVSFWNLDETNGMIAPHILPNVVYHLKAICEQYKSGLVYGGQTALSVTGFVLAIIGNLEGLPIWVSIGIQRAGLLTSTINLMEAILGHDKGSIDRQVRYCITLYADKVDWGSGNLLPHELQHSGTTTGFDGVIEMWNLQKGVWGNSWINGESVDVGQQVRTAVSVHLSSENEALPVDGTDVWGKIQFKRKDGTPVYDVRNVIYEWR